MTHLGYIPVNSILHKLTGATKIICLLLFCLATMFTYDTFTLTVLLVFGIVCFKLSHISFKQVSFIVYFILIFLLINNIAIFIFSPYEGCKIYDQKTVILPLIGSYSLTVEQLFYQFNITLKYLAVIPIALLFILTTNPSEFASSLNRIGVSYRFSYAVAIALRYIPDIGQDYQEICFAQQTRGMDLSRQEKLSKRIKNISSILMPLIFTSLHRIDTISKAMELRSFGKLNKRSWYNERPFTRKDFLALTIVSLLLIFSMFRMMQNGGRFYNPFI